MVHIAVDKVVQNNYFIACKTQSRLQEFQQTTIHSILYSFEIIQEMDPVEPMSRSQVIQQCN